MSLVVIERGGGVRAHDVLAVNVGLDRNVLADGEAERVRVVGQREAVAGRLACTENASAEGATAYACPWGARTSSVCPLSVSVVSVVVRGWWCLVGLLWT